MSERDRKILTCVATVTLSVNFIYITVFISALFAFLFSLLLSPLMIACGATAFLLEEYMIRLLNAHDYDISKVLDDLE
jgi:hypothetical protein